MINLILVAGLSMTGSMNDLVAKNHSGGLIYAYVVKKNPKATKINCDKATDKAEKYCGKDLMLPIVNDCIDIKPKEQMKKKRLILEYQCIQLEAE